MCGSVGNTHTAYIIYIPMPLCMSAIAKICLGNYLELFIPGISENSHWMKTESQRKRYKCMGNVCSRDTGL